MGESELDLYLTQGLVLIGWGGGETLGAGILGHGSSLPFTKGVRSGEKKKVMYNKCFQEHQTGKTELRSEPIVSLPSNLKVKTALPPLTNSLDLISAKFENVWNPIDGPA